MKRHVTSALIAGGITAVSGIALFLGISRSIEWLFAPAYLLMAPGLFLVFLDWEVEPMAQWFIQT